MNPILTSLLAALAVLIIALTVAWILIRKDLIRSGVLSGLIIILLAWMGAVLWVTGACIACGGRSLCCEWTGVGFVFYSGLAVSMLLIYGTVTFGYVHLLRAEKLSRPNHTREGRVDSRRPVFRSRLGLLIGITLVGAISLQQITDLATRGYLVGWQRLDGPGAETETILKNGDQSNRLVERGMCIYEFWAWPPPGQVVQSASLIYCSAASRREERYVALNDGSYWKWEHRIGSDLALSLSRFGALLIGSIGGYLGGILWIGRRLKSE